MYEGSDWTDDQSDDEEFRMYMELNGYFERRSFKGRANHWETYSDVEFIQRYRISKSGAEELLATIRSIEPLRIANVAL